MNLQITLENSKNLHAELSELIEKCQRASADLPNLQFSSETKYLTNYKPQIIPRDYEQLEYGDDCGTSDLVEKCHAKFVKIKKGLEKLETVHLAKMFAKQQELMLELSEKESKLDTMQRKVQIYEDFNSKLREKYKEMGREISENLNRLHINSTDLEVGKAVLAVQTKTKQYFTEIENFTQNLIDPVVNSFQQMFCLYSNTRRWLKELDPERIDFLAPELNSLEITSESVKSELFLECCKLRDELTGIKLALGHGDTGKLESISRKCSEGFIEESHSENSEDEWNWDKSKFRSRHFGGQKADDSHLRKVVREKIKENADLLARNAYLEKQIELLRSEFSK